MAVEGMADALSAVARTLQESDDVDSTLSAIVQSAVDNVPGAMAGGISLVEARRRSVSKAPSNPVVSALDELQSRLGEGPCLDAIWDAPMVTVDDMDTERRWPRFGPEARALGIGSMISLRLFVQDDALGSLNLYSSEPHGFPPDAFAFAQLFASHAAVALVGAQQEEHLRGAMDSRAVIGQAQGIVMMQRNLSGQQAFALLVAASQNLNIKLRELAEGVVQDAEKALAPPA